MNRRDQGLAIALVIVAIIVLALAMFALAHLSNTPIH